ncbi:hypothetical protein [Criblamydia sequanensis]|uniref:Membrane protein n=1 Tax=Candidatus Criblamydia sequanensis CRIB-18 TaxID=1437425 RepID=A0A090D2C6_9BACT|nr:hypothetical protein [Criblamydia sequanensis]CDR34540.1 putative membrane protein [Criblamydia sequanensis CRIB-18]
MQVLIYVTTLLMVFAILSYGKLESLKSFAILKGQSEVLRKETGRYFSHKSEWFYDETTFSKEENALSQESKNQPNKATRYINLSYLFKAPDEASEIFVKNLLKDLIDKLYEGKSFYEEIKQNRPAFVEELLERLKEEVKEQNRNPQKKIKTIQQIANLDLKDQELANAFYHMLKGSPPVDGSISQGYPSLLDYITLHGNGKIRVWLVPKELLSVIFGDEAIAAEVQNIRKELHKDLVQGKKQKEEVFLSFKEACERRIRYDLPIDKFNFEASCQAPKNN